MNESAILVQWLFNRTILMLFPDPVLLGLYVEFAAYFAVYNLRM